MNTYETIPYYIQAMEFTGDNEDKINKLTGGRVLIEVRSDSMYNNVQKIRYSIRTATGVNSIKEGDYIVTYDREQYQLIKKEQFEKMFRLL